MLPDSLLNARLPSRAGWRRLVRPVSSSRAPGRAGVTKRAAALCLLLAFAATGAGCGSKPVVTVSTESEAIEIIDVLRENGFEASKEEVGAEDEGKKRWQVTVNEGWFGSADSTVAMQVLRDRGFPRPDDAEANVPSSGGLFPTETEQKAQRQRELEVGIERQLRLLPNIVRVKVRVVLPEENFKFEPYPAKASVMIVHANPQPAFTPEQVQNSVAGAVPNLKPENVSVTLAHQPPRPVQRPDQNVRRRNLFIAAGVGVVTVLMSSLLVVLMLQSRRQRAELAQLREETAHAPDADDDAALEAAGGEVALPEAKRRWLDHESGAQDSAALSLREAPDGAADEGATEDEQAQESEQTATTR